MKRLLMLLAVAAVAGGMYAAAATGTQHAAGPTAKQFAALKKQVAGINKKLTAVKKLATVEAVLLAACDSEYASIDQYGDPTGAAPEGYRYSQSPIGTNETLSTALDIAPYTDSQALWITGGGRHAERPSPAARFPMPRPLQASRFPSRWDTSRLRVTRADESDAGW